VSPVLLATNSKIGIFGIFPKEQIYQFQNVNYKSDNKGKDARGKPTWFPSRSLMANLSIFMARSWPFRK